MQIILCFRSNLLPLKTLKLSYSISQHGNRISGVLCTACLGLHSKTQSFQMFVIKESDGFQLSLKYRRPYFGLVGDI